MEAVVIAAWITGGCAVIAAIIGGIVAIYQSKKKKENEKIELHINLENQTEIPIPPPPKHPVFLNPDDYEIDEEDYFVTLGGLLQQSRNPKDVSVKKIKKTYEGEGDEKWTNY